MKDGDLFAVFSQKDKEVSVEKLYPLGDKTFALKTDIGDMVFVNGGMTFYDSEGKKL